MKRDGGEVIKIKKGERKVAEQRKERQKEVRNVKEC